jgi:phenylalanyl-tRNA synthetase beta chain
MEIPSFKVDITREADVIEEILRIYGYNNIEFSSSIRSSIPSTPKPDPEKIKNGISDYLCANGFTEIMNNSLTRSSYYESNPAFPIENNIRILNPLSRDLDIMRQTMLYGGLETLAYNQNRKITDCKLFEFGNCYSLSLQQEDKSSLDKYIEENHLNVFITGRAKKENWNVSGRKADIYDLRGFINSIIQRTGLSFSSIETLPDTSGIFSQGLRYRIKSKTLVVLGALSNVLLKQLDIRQEVLYADFNWSCLLDNVKPGNKRVSELSKFPEVRRDLALELDLSVTYAEIEKLAFATEKKLLKEVGLFDVYEGDKIEAGKKSYAIYFILQDDQKTLTDEEIDKSMNRLIKVYNERINARVR